MSEKLLISNAHLADGALGEATLFDYRKVDHVLYMVGNNVHVCKLDKNNAPVEGADVCILKDAAFSEIAALKINNTLYCVAGVGDDSHYCKVGPNIKLGEFQPLKTPEPAVTTTGGATVTVSASGYVTRKKGKVVTAAKPVEVPKEVLDIQEALIDPASIRQVEIIQYDKSEEETE